MKSFALGIDIGGTSIKPQLFEVKDNIVFSDCCWKPETNPAFSPSLKAHKKQIALIIIQAIEKASSLGGKLIGVGIGSPGFFDTNGNIIVTHNPEFLHINLKDAYIEALQNEGLKEYSSIPIIVRGDAEIMLNGIVSNVLDDDNLSLYDQHKNKFSKTDLSNNYVSFFGIGTGIGHSTIKFDDQNRLSFPTQSHASELLVNIDDDDWELVEKLIKFKDKDNKNLRIFFNDKKQVRAEDLFRGPVINALAKIESDNLHEDASECHNRTFSFAGKYMARLIKLIAKGNLEATAPETEWCDEDKITGTKTFIYFISGGLGSSPLGKILIENSKQELGVLNNRIKIIHFPKNNVAEHAAAVSIVSSINS